MELLNLVNKSALNDMCFEADKAYLLSSCHPWRCIGRQFGTLFPDLKEGMHVKPIPEGGGGGMTITHLGFFFPSTVLLFPFLQLTLTCKGCRCAACAHIVRLRV